MSRSLKKGPFADASLLKKIDAMNAEGQKQIIKTWSRRSTIFPSFVGHTNSMKGGLLTWKRKLSIDHKLKEQEIVTIERQDLLLSYLTQEYQFRRHAS